LWGPDLADNTVKLIRLNLGLWGTSSLSTEFRNFLFNFTQGRLYLNSVLARIDGTLDKCTFCLIKAKMDLRIRGITEEMPEHNYYLQLQSPETISHLFWNCDIVQPLIQKCFRWIRNLDTNNALETIDKEIFMLGCVNDWTQLVTVDLVWKHFVKFYIYVSRNKRKLPTFASLKFELEGLFGEYRMRKFRSNLLNLAELYEED
jgi:hypothetical protein